MTLREVLKKIEAMPFKRSEKARITRGSWKGFGWYIPPGLLQDRLWKVVFPRA